MGREQDISKVRVPIFSSRDTGVATRNYTWFHERYLTEQLGIVVGVPMITIGSDVHFFDSEGF